MFANTSLPNQVCSMDKFRLVGKDEGETFLVGEEGSGYRLGLV